ncbi:hypothetical protein AKJ39_02575 [candidate division MSBL1 archaeon SCGC-AAA259J03]|uniref:Ribbon-helix-helix protein CopG domain-containing protein n=2 Tax=candidate division MSBL1 TaxID=215777 RepID=A0A656YW20_9EURY|nr:hypothetical protein AKJ61_01845 [candidate division MSBL1 archaeon SCGC-AAA259B11]KXA98042.1 hypothetical protein AKJ39_02575 [candidate division MSBL1 archaeon SCGC-AAA259J03]
MIEMMTLRTGKKSVSVVLTEKIIKKLDELVKEGCYESRSEAVRKPLRKGRGIDFSDKNP